MSRDYDKKLFEIFLKSLQLSLFYDTYFGFPWIFVGARRTSDKAVFFHSVSQPPIKDYLLQPWQGF